MDSVAIYAYIERRVLLLHITVIILDDKTIIMVFCDSGIIILKLEYLLLLLMLTKFKNI